VVDHRLEPDNAGAGNDAFGIRGDKNFGEPAPTEGVTSARVNATLKTSAQKGWLLRVSLSGDQTYEDVEFFTKQECIEMGIPDIFGDFQLVFKELRNKRRIIVSHQMNVTQIECVKK
jgi:hypothetical protein